MTGCDGENTGPSPPSPVTSTETDQGAPVPVTAEDRGSTYSTRPACEGIACW